MTLFDSVVYPTEPHVHGLGLLLAKFLSCNTYSSEIFHLDGCGYLFPSHLREGGSDEYRCLGVYEDGAVFGLGC